MSTPSTKRQLVRMFNQQNGICCYCDGQTHLPAGEPAKVVAARLGIPVGVIGWREMLIASRATREHLKKRADGGANQNNLKMACYACNIRRGDSDPDVHRIDMQVLVADGLHPTNRPRIVDDPKNHIRLGLKALRKLRAGEPPTQEKPL